MYERFQMEFTRCWACGWSPLDSPRRDWMRPELHRAHIIGGVNRRHDRRCICMLCEGCHRLSHGACIRPVAGEARLPPLTYPNLLWLKRARDPAYYDRAYLRELTGGHRVPNAKRPPLWFRTEYFRQPVMSPPHHKYGDSWH
jgi:hypothetical protein